MNMSAASVPNRPMNFDFLSKPENWSKPQLGPNFIQLNFKVAGERAWTHGNITLRKEDLIKAGFMAGDKLKVTITKLG